MVSIGKMDLNWDAFDSDSMDDEIHIKEELPDKEEPIEGLGLDLIPVVYTTRLDDMVVLSSDTSKLHKSEITARILEESKPTLHMLPISNYSQSNKRNFNAMKAKLKKVYHDKISLETNLNIKLEYPAPIIDADSIKCEVPDDPIDAFISTRIQADPLKREVLVEPVVTCKYSELLKLCRPCRVVLPKLFGHEVVQKDTSQYIKILKAVTSSLRTPVTSQKKYIVPVNKTNKNQDIQGNIASSSDDEPLITLTPSLKPILSDAAHLSNLMTKLDQVKARKPFEIPVTASINYQKTCRTITQLGGSKILSNGLMAVTDFFSKEFNVYGTDKKGNLLEYYKDIDDNAHHYEHMKSSDNASNLVTLKNCCWVQRDGMIQSMYPNVLLYSNLRFIRKPHRCPPGACHCCCKKYDNLFEKPDIVFTDDASSEAPPPFLKEDLEIQALENEIQSSILKMSKEPRVHDTDILRNLLHKPNANLPVNKHGSISLIDKALMYKKPLPKKPKANRRLLLSSELETSQAGVMVLRNFASDEREIYEFNAVGDLKSYLKLTCFTNTDQPEVKKLLQKSKQVNDVCCWFKRETVITELIEAKTLHRSAVKFIRTRHMCVGDECSCCCKPNDVKDVTLTDIKFPSRPTYWPELLKFMKAPHKPSRRFDTDTSMDDLPRSYKNIPSIWTRPVVTAVKPPRDMPSLLDDKVLQTPAPPLDNQHVKPSASLANNKTMTDNDCEFVSVTAAPKPTIALTALNPAPVEQNTNTTNVQDGVLSQEVNTLISSILDRFKDVKLTINSDGKVSAALNTPVSTLSTVELKVLANILSYAQSQVNSFGLNAGMSLSNMIKLKAGDAQSATTPSIDADSVYKTFGHNVNINNQSQAAHSTATADVVRKPNKLPELSSTPTSHDVNDYFTKSSYMRNEEFTDSFTSLLSTKLDAEDSNDNVPVIQNVFSLNDGQSTKTANETFSSSVSRISTTVWARTPLNQLPRPSSSKTDNDAQKVNATNMKRAPPKTETKPPVTKKMKGSSTFTGAAQLDATSVSKLKEMVTSVFKPPPLQTHTLEVSGLTPGGPSFSNPKFRVLPARPPIQVGTKPRIIRKSNFKTYSNPSTSQPSIIVSPLNVAKFDDNLVDEDSQDSKDALMEGTPSSEESAAEDEESVMSDAEIKIEEVFNEDDDCILGM